MPPPSPPALFPVTLLRVLASAGRPRATIPPPSLRRFVPIHTTGVRSVTVALVKKMPPAKSASVPGDRAGIGECHIAFDGVDAPAGIVGLFPATRLVPSSERVPPSSRMPPPSIVGGVVRHRAVDERHRPGALRKILAVGR